ncbi:MAG: DNA-directed RNA polymerase subunit omega [Clostridia bacterium]|nr:DNA-directed RNA polymerase subunit omega [Clostridia bacterium]
MRFITHEYLKNEVNKNADEEIIVSKYELVMLIAKRAKQIAEDIAAEEAEIEHDEYEEIHMRKPITEAINELEQDLIEVVKDFDEEK